MNKNTNNKKPLQTLALLPYPLLKWLDSTGLNSLLIALAYFFTTLGLFLLLELGTEPEAFPKELKIIVTMLGCIFLAIWLVLVRGAQKDFTDIQSYSVNKLPAFGIAICELSRAFRILELTGGVLLGYSISFSGRAMVEEISFFAAIITPITDYEAGIFGGLHSNLVSLIFIFAGVCIVRTVTFLYRQIILFHTSAKVIQMDLLNPEPMAAFAGQPLRVFFGLAALVATVPFALTTSEEFARTLIPIGVPLMSLMAMLLLMVSIPIWTIRNRLKESKKQELSLITIALTGDRSALSRARIAEYKDEFQLPELLYYRERINSVWEWPLQAHIRRIAFYVVLPPLAWVLAAVVEMYVEAALV